MNPACIAMLVPAVLAAGCTTVRDDSRRTVTWLDEHCTPESASARWAASPLSVPVGFLALVVDTAVVNPVCAIDDAWGDTVDLLWTTRDESALRRALFTPLAGIATPLVFAADWLWRCVVPIEPRQDAEVKQ